MTDIIVIAAVAENGVIGRKNDIPWRISDDFKRFKRLTLGFPCVMGDATFESLPDSSRPLPGRENVVLTLDPNYRPSGVTLFHDFDKAISYVRTLGLEKAFITGGATIYRLAMKVADRLELTRIHHDYPGDVRFPDFDRAEWELVTAEEHDGLDSIGKQSVRYTYESYRRRNHHSTITRNTP